MNVYVRISDSSTKNSTPRLCKAYSIVESDGAAVRPTATSTLGIQIIFDILALSTSNRFADSFRIQVTKYHIHAHLPVGHSGVE
eukprot:1391864-Amorphochlora_amoeboformis.AAC.1